MLISIIRLVMRLGKKKEKDRELEKQCIDGIARLICSPKQSHPVPLRGIKAIFVCLFVFVGELKFEKSEVSVNCNPFIRL